MKNSIRSGLVIIMLFLSNNVFGYFYHVCVMNKHTKRQHVVLLGDYHDKKHPANKGQRAYLESLLKKYNSKKVKLIVEDLSSVNNDGRMICCNFGINCDEGVLGRLANKARALGIAVDNVEYRYCRVAGIGPLLNNITSNPHSFRSSVGITIASLHKEIVDEIEKIKKYDDGKKLNAFYKRTIAEVRDMLSKTRLCTVDQKTTVAHHCAALQQGKYRKELEKLCIFDSALVDINIMHSIICCDAPIILVVAGGSHIEHVNKLLKKNGYEVVFISSDSQGEPVDITILDKFIK